MRHLVSVTLAVFFGAAAVVGLSSDSQAMTESQTLSVEAKPSPSPSRRPSPSPTRRPSPSPTRTPSFQ